MRLLVSVRNAQEALVAVAGGADVIDAKEPRNGTLGAVSRGALAGISRALAADRPLSVALGDASQPDAVAAATRRAAELGASWIKVGLAGVSCGHRAAGMLARFRRVLDGQPTGLIAVAYADSSTVGAPDPEAVVGAAMQAGASGVLLDTARKDSGSLFELLPISRVGEWVAAAHALGLQAGVAGKLTAAEVPIARYVGADVVGVRGAACDGGRLGVINQHRVAKLALICCNGDARSTDAEYEEHHRGRATQAAISGREGPS